MTNSADPDQLASSEANWSGSTLFAKTGHVVFSKRNVKHGPMGIEKKNNKTKTGCLDACLTHLCLVDSSTQCLWTCPFPV